MQIHNKRRILVVDDNVSIVDLLVQFLEKKGFQTRSAHDGLAALKLIRSISFDVVITDWQMPGLDGLTLAAEVKKRKPDTVTVVMTGSAEMDTPTKREVDHLLEKPFSLKAVSDLLNCVRQTEDAGLCRIDRRMGLAVS